MTYRVGSNTVITTTDYASNTFASNGRFASVFYKTARVLFTMQGETYGYAVNGATPGDGVNIPFTITSIYRSIDRFPFASDTNATNIGDMITATLRSAGQTSVTHGYVSGGIDPTNPALASTRIETFPFSSSVSSVLVGNASQRYNHCGHSSLINGYNTLGRSTPTSIERFPFASVVSVGIGTTTVGRHQSAGLSSFDYAYMAGGLAQPFATNITSNFIDRFPFSAEVGSRSVGTLAFALYDVTGVNSYDYGFVIGGIPPFLTSDGIQRFPFASATTNAADVGSLSGLLQGGSGQSSFTHGYHSGSTLNSTPSIRANIGKFPFASASVIDAAFVGNLSVERGGSVGYQS